MGFDASDRRTHDGWTDTVTTEHRLEDRRRCTLHLRQIGRTADSVMRSPEASVTVGARTEPLPLARRAARNATAYPHVRRRRKADRTLGRRRLRLYHAACMLVALMLYSNAALATVVAAVNHARTAYCGLSSASYPPLTESPKLNEVARLLAHGESLSGAERRAGYIARRALWIRITGTPNDAAVERVVGRQFCAQLADPKLRGIGSYPHGAHELWIVLAQPLRIPPARTAAAVRRRILQLTNEARAQERTCGPRRFPAAPPLTLAPALTRAAEAHARDMAAHGLFSHIGSNGSTPAERITRAGYRWSRIGENIASDVGTPRKAVADWLASPPHCANIMNARFRQMGVAFAVNDNSAGTIYWTEEFATPR